MNDATLLEKVLDGDTVPDEAMTDEVGRLVALARTLSEDVATTPVRMAEESRTELRMALLREAAERRAAPPPLLVRMRERLTAAAERLAYSARAAGAGGLAAAVLSGGGVAVAADASLPGDLFYGLKLTIEDVALSFGGAGAPRGDALLSRADVRIEEAARSLDAGATTSAAAALRLADQDARDGAHELLTAYLETSDTELLDGLDGWVVTTSRRLALLPAAEGDAAAALGELRTTLDRIDQRVEVLATGACTSCELGVHDDTADAQDSARGVEADGTPPVPAAPVDLTVIPRADEPFQACPCVPAGPPTPPVPAPEGAEDDIEPAAEDLPPEEPAEDQTPDVSDDGSDAEEPGGGSERIPLPDTGPLVDPLPDPVREPVEDVLDDVADPALPDAGSTPSAPAGTSGPILPSPG